MGSQYTLLDNEQGEICLNEMSCRFDLQYDSSVVSVTAFTGLEPEQVVDMAIKMIHAASYFVADPQNLMNDASERARKY